MNIGIFEIRCTKCKQGVFRGEAYKEVCTHCGTPLTDDLIEADLKNRSKELMGEAKDSPEK